MSLGYGNFAAVIQFDLYAQAEQYLKGVSNWIAPQFTGSSYGLKLTSFESSKIINSPNLLILPLLAYHKICNDHYRNEKWQPFEPWSCNIDYLKPNDNMNAKSFIQSSTFTALMTSIIDLENSNLPIDYLSCYKN